MTQYDTVSEQPLFPTFWSIPNAVRIDGGKLLWTGDLSSAATLADHAIKISRDDRDLLKEFVQLSRAPARERPDRILDFTKKWGPLGLCERHGLPVFHGWFDRGTVKPVYAPEMLGFCPPGLHNSAWQQLVAMRKPDDTEAQAMEIVDKNRELIEGGELWEPLVVWEFYSRNADALLALARCVATNQPGNEVDWQAAIKRQPRQGESHGKLLAEALNRTWLFVARPQPYVSFDAGFSLHFVSSAITDPVVREGARMGVQPGWTGALFCELALRITTAMSDTTYGLARCCSCSDLYRPKRAPVLGRRNFCGKKECRRRTAMRLAKRDQRARETEGTPQ
jgi:hypothetical protein